MNVGPGTTLRALCTGDNQIGATTVTLNTQEHVWNQAVDHAIRHQANLVLHAGDLYEGPLVTPEHLLAFRRPLARLRDAGIPTVLIRGNGRHDAATHPVDALDVFHDYPLLTVSQRPGLVVAGGCAVATLPWVSPAALVAATNGRADPDNLNAYTADRLVQVAADLRGQAEREHPGLPCVLLAHWSISGASLPTGLPVAQLSEPVLEWAELDRLGFAAVVAGHIHQPQRLDNVQVGDRTVGFYVGSPQPLNFGEAGEHGCWLLEVERGQADATFLPLESPQFVTVKVDPDAIGAWEAVSGVSAGAIVRVRYEATPEQDARVDKQALRRMLLEAGASRVSIEPRLVREVRSRAVGLTERLGPLEALSMWCAAESVDAARAALMAARLRGWVEA